MNFCSECGSAKLERRVPPGDTHERYVCESCGMIHYENPRMIVGTLPRWGDRILLCRRAIEPRVGTWTLPAGFMENGETLEEGAVRETWEEAGCRVNVERLFCAVSVPVVNQVYCLFLADIDPEHTEVDAEGEPVFPFGPETSEVRLATVEEIPWDELSFHSIVWSLQRYREWVRGERTGTEALMGVVERNRDVDVG